jgi:cytochrome P450
MPPLFVPASETWILSRYRDVSDALLAPELTQSKKVVDPMEDKAQHTALKAAVQADIDRLSSAEWHARAADSLAEVILAARKMRRVDLVRDVIHRWTSRVVTNLNGRAEDNQRLERISKELFYQAALKKPDHNAAENALDTMIRDGRLTVSKSLFFGFTQTLSSFLAKSWLALLLNHTQCEQLKAHPNLIWPATEELLRYAGVVHTLVRTASKDICIGNACIRRGQRLTLEIDSANFDVLQFTNSEQLDFARRVRGHLGLGRGLHACVGSYLVRMACSVGIEMFLQAGFSLDPSREAVWTGDSTMLWPISVPVTIQRH